MPSKLHWMFYEEASSIIIYISFPLAGSSILNLILEGMNFLKNTLA
jgi:hypothetical protein